MFSVLKPNFLYTDVSEDITENDIDVISDLWTMDGREVYRGSRDPRYTHANVYWLYDEDLQRVGCTEHSLADHGVFEILWFRDSEFGTLLQEDGWKISSDIWSGLPENVFNRFVNEEWVNAESFLEQCLYGNFRIVTPKMMINRPNVYTCQKCGRKSLRPIPSCSGEVSLLDFPSMEKVVFVDDDLLVHIPPPDSTVFRRLQLGDDYQSFPREPVQEEQSEPQPEAQAPQSPPEKEQEHQLQQEQEQPPRQSRPQTPEQQSGAEEATPEHTSHAT